MTFNYSPAGPQGLVADRPVYIVSESGGVPTGSALDHATTWLTLFLGFLGMSTVHVIAAESLSADPAAGMSAWRHGGSRAADRRASGQLTRTPSQTSGAYASNSSRPPSRRNSDIRAT